MTPDDNPRRRPQTVGGVVYLVVVAMVLSGVASAVLGAWRTGVGWMGAGLLAGAATRLVLPEERAGMLRVRRKATDVVMLVLAGVGLIVLAVVVPNQTPVGG